MKKLFKWVLGFGACVFFAEAGVAELLVKYEFNTNDTPDIVAPNIAAASRLDAPLSDLKGDTHSDGNPIPSFYADMWSNGLNRFEFTVQVADGYVMSLERIVFDYRSEVDGAFMGPVEYELQAQGSGDPGSLTGGWQELVRDNAWHAGVVVSNRAGIVVEEGGQLTVQIFGRGASHSEAFWWIDNVAVYGVVSPAQPEVLQAALVSGNMWLAIQPFAPGFTCQVERASTFSAGAGWTSVYSFVAATAVTNWSEPLPAGTPGAFYRVTVQRE